MTFLLVASDADSLISLCGPLLEALIDRGAEVHVAVPEVPPGSPLRRCLENRGLRVHDLPLQHTGMNPWQDGATLLHLWRLKRLLRPTCVLGYTAKPVIYGILAATLARVPQRFALITGLGHASTGERRNGTPALLHLLVGQLYALALRGTHKVFFQNPDDQARFREHGLLKPTTPSCLLNGSGLDLDRYRVEPLPALPCFLLIAHLLGGKGVREYVAAARQVKARFPEAKFSLVGWTDDDPDAIAREELAAWVKSGIIRYLGRLDDHRPALADCSVYVLPSYRERMPRTMLEAMAMGRAIITTDAPGCRETVVPGENGFLVPVATVDELAQAMLRFLEEPILVARMGTRSRQIAEEKFDVRRINARMLQEMGLP